MNPRATVAEWEAAVGSAGSDPFAELQGELSNLLEDLRRPGDLPTLSAALARLVIVHPGQSGSRLSTLMRSIDRAVKRLNTSEARAIVPADDRLAIIDLINILECSGVVTASTAGIEVRQWLSELATADLPRMRRIGIGFAALALTGLDVAQEIAGPFGAPNTPFQRTNYPKGDALGLLGYLIGALRLNANSYTVLPAWRLAIEQVNELRSDGQIDERSMLWIARLVYHDFGKQPLDTVASSIHEILWRVPLEIEQEAADGLAKLAPSTEFPLGYTLGNGAYRVDEHLLGDGLQQMFAGRHVPSGDPVLLAVDSRGSSRSIDELRAAISYHVPGVLELGFVGGFDRRGEKEDYKCDGFWATVERGERGTWLPRALPKVYDSRAAPQMAIELGLSAGRILAAAAKARLLLTRVRPEYMWAERTANHWAVTGLSVRGDELFRRKSSDHVTPPVFDRYYYAPEWNKDPDDRALVFSLGVMIAEWSMGRYPFEHQFHGRGLEQAEHLPIEAPSPLREYLEEAIQLDRQDRPDLEDFLLALGSCGQAD
jgi:hypothetical protein